MSKRPDAYFSMIPEFVLDAGISPTAYMLYGALARKVGKDRSGYARIKDLADRIVVSESTARRALAELAQKRLVTVRHQWTDGDGSFSTERKPGWRQTVSIYMLATTAPMIESDIPGEGVTDDRGEGVTSDLLSKNPLTSEPNTLLPTVASTASDGAETSSSLRSPSLSERRTQQHIIQRVRDIAQAESDEDEEAAVYRFLEDYEAAYGLEAGYWDYGWDTRLHGLVKRHGIEYGTAKWLGIFRNSAEAA